MREKVAAGVIGALVLLVVVLATALAQQLAAEEDAPTGYTGSVVNISPDAIVVQSSDGKRYTGLLATEQGTLRRGDSVRFEVVTDPDVIYVADVG